MNVLEQMLSKYTLNSTADYEAAMREIIQEICLLGLWRGKFFEHAAFYGGTALRLFYGLDRFSEDLDFSLLEPEDGFRLSDYFQNLKMEMEAFGLSVRIEEKKSGTAVESGFIKADTRTYLIQSQAPESMVGRVHSNQVLKVKFEVDTNPPGKFETENRFLLFPIPFSVRVYRSSSLFSGKMHALLCRQWGERVKGRDWYDLIFYVGRKIPLNLSHLRERLIQTGQLEAGQGLTPGEVRNMLQKAIANLDMDRALKDVMPFVKNRSSLDGWSRELFMEVSRQLLIEEVPNN